MMKTMAILTDITKCIGCEACVTACKSTYQLPPDKPWRWQKDVNDLSATRWTTIVNRPGEHHVREQCRHCAEPACASACPVGALHKTPEGPIVYDGSICMGCRYCMMACPYGIPRYTWDEPVPYVRKCIMCHEKIRSGEQTQPSCTNACPTGATVFGDRDDLLALAHQTLKTNPGKYIDRVWGEKEVGGSNVLYLSPIKLDFLGLKPDLGVESLPARTWPALRIVPGVFVGVGIAMSAACWVVGRRMKIMNEQAPAVNAPEKNETEPPEKAKKEEAGK
ncbi:MAG: 4Fe-4S dicluster domain-containing protein [Planctomycetota bacterium]